MHRKFFQEARVYSLFGRLLELLGLRRRRAPVPIPVPVRRRWPPTELP